MVYGETPTAAKWSELGANDDALANGSALAVGSVSSEIISNPCKFYVYLATTVNPSTNPIKFDTKVYDTGNNYNISTGAFTAPVSGFYVFSCTLTWQYASSGNNIGIQFIKNGAYSLMPGVNIVTSYNTSFTEGISLTTPPLQLAANDALTIQGDDTSHPLVGANPPESFLGGYLLSRS